MCPNFLAAGAKVVLIDRARERLEQLTNELGENAFPLVIDLLKPQEISGMLQGILDAAGGLDIFYANAGAYVGGRLRKATPMNGTAC